MIFTQLVFSIVCLMITVLHFSICYGFDYAIDNVDSLLIDEQKCVKKDTTLSEDKRDDTEQNKNQITYWYQFSTHRLDEFNHFLDSYQMPSIKQSNGVGVEIKIQKISIPIPENRFTKDTAIEIKIIPTLSIDFVYASSQKSKPQKMKWLLNVYGISFGPNIEFSSIKNFGQLSIRPRIGYHYSRGIKGYTRWTEENVTGDISLHGSDIGYSVFFHYRCIKPSWLISEVGYRWLNFNSLKQDTEGEWLLWYESNVPSPFDLDLSGWVFRLGGVTTF